MSQNGEKGRPDARLSGRGSAADLLALQRQAWTGLVFSITRRCPLSCTHCITRSGPDPSLPLLPLPLADQWAAELPTLQARGLTHISFTGGEPLLAVKAVQRLSSAAAHAGIANFVVTSAAWASSPSAAARMVERLPAVSHWDIGYDDFHAAQMPASRLTDAVAALEDAGASYTVRVCVAEGSSSAALDRVAQRVGPRGQFLVQSVRAIGRADTVPVQMSRDRAGLPRRPCVSTGLFVRADGTTGPCCSGLAYEATGSHPFDYGDASEPGGLLRAWRRWHDDSLLRMLRLVGFPALEGWIAEQGSPIRPQPRDPCEACVGLWRSDPALGPQLARRAAQPSVQEQLDGVEAALYGEVWRQHHDVSP